MKYQKTIPNPTPHTPYSDRQFLHTTGAGVQVPLLQAALTGFMMMLAAGAVLFWFDAIDIIKPMLIIGTLTTVGTWLFLQSRWLKLTRLEELLGLDLNQDGHVGEQRIRVQIDHVEPNGHVRQSMMFDLPEGITLEQLQTYADGILNRNMPTTITEWGGPGKLFKEVKYRELRKEMIKRKLLEKANIKSGTLGFIYNDEGKALLKRFLEVAHLEELAGEE